MAAGLPGCRVDGSRSSTTAVRPSRRRRVTRRTSAAAFYTYIGKGLGRPVGSGSAGVALFAYCAVQAAMYGLYGSIVSALVEQYTGLNAPWWLWALVTMAIVQVLGSAGIE